MADNEHDQSEQANDEPQRFDGMTNEESFRRWQEEQ